MARIEDSFFVCLHLKALLRCKHGQCLSRIKSHPGFSLPGGNRLALGFVLGTAIN